MMERKVKKKYDRRKEYTRRKLRRRNVARKGKWIRNLLEEENDERSLLGKETG